MQTIPLRRFEGTISDFEDVTERAFQALHDLLQLSKRDALLSVFDAMECRGGEAELPFPRGERLFAASLAKKRTELPLERTMHSASVQEFSFRMWNSFLTRERRLSTKIPTNRFCVYQNSGIQRNRIEKFVAHSRTQTLNPR